MELEEMVMLQKLLKQFRKKEMHGLLDDIQTDNTLDLVEAAIGRAAIAQAEK